MRVCTSFFYVHFQIALKVCFFHYTMAVFTYMRVSREGGGGERGGRRGIDKLTTGSMMFGENSRQWDWGYIYRGGAMDNEQKAQTIV